MGFINILTEHTVLNGMQFDGLANETLNFSGQFEHE